MMVHQTEITPLEKRAAVPFWRWSTLACSPREEVCSLAHQAHRPSGTTLIRRGTRQHPHSERHSEGTRATGTGLASRLLLWGWAPVARQPDATPTYRGSLEPSSVSGVKVRRKQLLRSQPSVSQV